MRMARALLLPAFVVGLLVALGGHNAAALVQAPKPSGGGRGLVLDVIMECGTFDGKFQCRPARGGKAFGKGASPGDENKEARPEPQPGGVFPGQAVQGAPADPNACQGGMVGTPPNCRCPESTEQLGGICVRYTASTCSNGLAVNAPPEACQGVEEKVSCKLRDDGLKDCCCITYDKF
jgi:hypothetical protein